jgi:hypothetical protein
MSSSPHSQFPYPMRLRLELEGLVRVFIIASQLFLNLTKPSQVGFVKFKESWDVMIKTLTNPSNSNAEHIGYGSWLWGEEDVKAHPGYLPFIIWIIIPPLLL